MGKLKKVVDAKKVVRNITKTSSPYQSFGRGLGGGGDASLVVLEGAGTLPKIPMPKTVKLACPSSQRRQKGQMM